MTLIKTSLLNGFATIIRIGALLGLNKVFAIYLGPAGYALIGEFSNIVSLVSSISGGNIVSTGVTKYTAEYFDDEKAQHKIWRTASIFLASTCFPIAILILIYREELSIYLFESLDFVLPIVFLAISLPLIALNSLLLAILNGKKNIRLFVLQNIIASIFSALLSGFFAFQFGVTGALVAICINQSLILFITVLICRDQTWLHLRNFIGPPEAKVIKKLLGYAFIALTGAILAPLGQYIVRNHLIQKFGLVEAGEWQAIFKISEIYLMLFTATLSIYYLPRISEIRDNYELKKEINKVYRFILPLAIFSAVVIYLLREIITVLLFTKEFLGMLKLYSWQLTGDVLKIGSWILAFVMVGREMVSWFILSEILFTTTWIALSIGLTNAMGIEGAPAAFALNYGIYWIFMALILKYKILEK